MCCAEDLRENIGGDTVSHVDLVEEGFQRSSDQIPHRQLFAMNGMFGVLLSY